MFRGFGKKIESIPLQKINLFLFFAWLIEQILIYNYCGGIRIVFDSHRYIKQASTHPDLFYSYTYLIAPFVKYNFLEAVIILQIILSVIAFWIYLKIINEVTSNNLVYLFGVLLFLWPELQIWNYYIHTESIFISLSVIALYFYFNKSYSLTFLICFTLCLIRPNGFIFLLGFSIFYFHQKVELKTFLISSIALILILTYISFEIILPKIFNIFSLYSNLTSGLIIQGYKDWHVGSSLTECSECELIKKSTYVIINNPFFYFKLFTFRFIIYVTQFRPYYTSYHNMFIIISFLVIYFGVCKSIITDKFKRIGYLILPTVFQILIVIVSGVDWDNRFIVIILPNIFILSVMGYNQLLKTKNLSTILY